MKHRTWKLSSILGCLVAMACGPIKPGTGTGGTGGTGGDDSKAYCGKQMLELPPDPGARGPWQVGARDVKIGYLKAAVWYPAKPGSEQGLPKLTYDLREYLPSGDRGALGDEATLFQPCDCFSALPIDDQHGPYPVIVFGHGFSGFKGQSLEFMVHWASRGFVVLAADAPSIGLKTFLNLFSLHPDPTPTGSSTPPIPLGLPPSPTPSCDPRVGGDQTRDMVFMLDSLKQPQADLAFLADRVDLSRIGAAGHSAGAGAVFSMGGYPGVKVVIPMAGGGTCAGASLQSTLVVGGMKDSIVSYGLQQAGYQSSPRSKRLVGLSNAGHMAETSFCPIGAADGGIIAAAKKAGVVFNPGFEAFITPLSSDGCGPNSLPTEKGWSIIEYASAATFEETLDCLPARGAKLSEIRDQYPDVGEYLEEL